MNNKIITQLKILAKKDGNKYALVELDGSQESRNISYGEFFQRVERLGKKLINKGYSNETILLFMNNDINSIISLYACFYADVVPVIKSYNKDKLELSKYKQEIEMLFNAFDEIKYIFVDDFLNLKVAFLDLLKEKVININSYNIKKNPPKSPLISKNHDFILFTSGSTAIPKCVKISIDKMINNILFKTNLWNVRSTDNFLNWLPISHIYGLTSIAFAPLHFGATSYLMKPHQYYNNCYLWLDCITKFNITHSSIINFAFNQLISLNLNTKCINLSSLKNLSIGGEPVKINSLEEFYKKYSYYGFKYSCFSPSYGMSENSGLVSEYKYNDNTPLYISIDKSDLTENKVSVVETGIEVINLGKISKTNIKIQNIKGQKIINENEIGELLIGNESLYIGYLGQNDFDSDYFHTGDLGFIHNECLYLSGRIKDIIIIRGKNFSSSLIENAISNELRDYNFSYNALLSLPNSDEVVFVQEVVDIIPESVERKVKSIIQEIIFKYTKYLISSEKIYLINSDEIPKLNSGKLDKMTLVKRLYEEELV